MADNKAIHMFQNSWFSYGDNTKNNDYNYQKTTSSAEDSTISNGSSICSSDTEDDVSSSSNSSGALYDLSEIMAQLPIKRGLSKFYQGKSESFTSLSSVTSVDDLVKKVSPYRKKLKASKSCETGLSCYKSYTHPKAIISKKLSSSSFSNKRGSCMSSKRPPLTPHPVHNNLGC